LKLIKLEFIKKKNGNVSALDSQFSFAEASSFSLYSTLSFANTITHGTQGVKIKAEITWGGFPHTHNRKTKNGGNVAIWN
jgi:hypothetical protein